MAGKHTGAADPEKNSGSRKPKHYSNSKPEQKAETAPVTEEKTETEETKAEPAAESVQAEPVDPKIPELENRVAELEKTAADTKDQLLRTLAEYDNYRKRTDKEKDAIYNHAVRDTVAEILNVADTMEMALAHKESDADALRKGVEMIQKNLLDTLTKLKVEQVGEIGETFDPNLHQAVAHVEDESLGENVISQIYRRGYKIGDLVIRPATVVVAN